MTRHVEGSFEVTMTPQSPPGGPETGLNRLSLDKRYHGALEAESTGEMLSALTPVKGSAAYVAVERVTGTLEGRRGSFSLQHSGTMTRGTRSLTITVVPDSGTAELAGLEGRMSIAVEDGRHRYGFDYTLPPTSP